MATREPDLVKTGVAGLDEILLGGVRRNNNILVEGPPGSGKTTLGLAFIQAGAARLDQPGVIVSFELDSEKLLRDAEGFEWDLAGEVERGRVKILETTPDVLLEQLRIEDGVFGQELAAIGARRLFIDGMTPLRLYAEANGISYRESIHRLIEELTRFGITSLVTSEREDGAGVPHERYVFDTIIALDQVQSERGLRRSIAVTKSRGQDFIGGTHTLRIAGGTGIEVYRRVQSRPKIIADQPTSTTRVSTGSTGLDALMEGGVYKGSITLVSGISGTGKTVSGAQFLSHGARNGKKGLLVTLDEHPRQLIRNATTLGFDLERLIDEEKIFIHYESPLELELDVHFDKIARLVEDNGIELVVCDSVAVYQMHGGRQANDFLYALASFFKQRLCTVFFNYESPELLGVSQISRELQGSHLVDNIVLLNYVEISTKLRRAICVPKVRGTNNVQTTHEFVIEAGGIHLLPPEEDSEAAVPQLPFSYYYGLLARSPARRAPVIEEAVMHGDKLPQGDSDDVDR